MKRMSHLRIVAWVAVAGLWSVVLVTGGCAATELAADSRLPDEPGLVGGGMLIEWKAPEPGTAYLVERRTGKIVETRSLAAGQIYAFSATSVVQADEFEQMLGIRFARAQFLLYFEPLAGESTVTVTSKPLRTGSRS
ncbi:MAG: hypothetical protein FJ280_14725 [Planctomycetes bacterium]|nr:hypothetical protein [Planctomycetota bacterium]